MAFFFRPVGLLMSFSILYPILQSFFLYDTHGVLPISPRPSQPFSNCLYVGIYALFVSCLFPPPDRLYIPTRRPSRHIAKTAPWNQATPSRQALLKLIAHSRFTSNLDDSQRINQRGSRRYQHRKSCWGKICARTIDITSSHREILVFENLWSLSVSEKREEIWKGIYDLPTQNESLQNTACRAWDSPME